MRHMIFIATIILIFVLTGCNSGSINGQDWEIINEQNQESSEPQDQEVTDDQRQENVEDQENTNEQGQKGEENLDQKNVENSKKEIMIGTWQESPSVGSLFASRYHFYGNCNYIFEYSQYDESKRILSEMGTWSVESDTLALIVKSKITVVGGEKGAPGPNSTSEYSIVNGKIEIIEVNPPKKEEYELNNMYRDTEERIGYWVIIINGTQYWRLLDDPNAYLNEPLEDGEIYSS